MTERVQRFFAVQAEQDSGLGPRQVRLRASTEALGRDNLIVVSRGIDLGPYKSNPVMLWGHDPDQPIARASEVSIDNNELHVLAEFAEPGTCARADEVCGLVKQGIVSGISIGFDPKEVEPVDPKNRSSGKRITRSELFEISFVSVPAERNSLVTERTAPANDNERKPLTIRGLYEVAGLACSLNEIGWIADCAAWEAEYEGDSSPVPAMLIAAMKQLGEALIAMTQEEVAELLAVNDDESSYVLSAAPGTERMQRTVGLLKERAGKAISAATKAKLQTVHDHCDNAMRCVREMMDEEDRDMDEGGDEMRSSSTEVSTYLMGERMTPENSARLEAWNKSQAKRLLTSGKRPVDLGGDEMRAALEAVKRGEMTLNEARATIGLAPITVIGPANDNEPLTPAEKFRRQLALRSRGI